MEILERPKAPDYTYTIKYNGIEATINEECFCADIVVHRMYLLSKINEDNKSQYIIPNPFKGRINNMKTASQIEKTKHTAREMAKRVYFNNIRDEETLINAISQPIESGLVIMEENAKLRDALTKLTAAYINNGGSDKEIIDNCVSILSTKQSFKI